MRKNNDWNRVSHSEYGVEKFIVNPKKGFTLLYNAKATVEQYCVAWKYNEEDNTWVQGHYFNDFYNALEYMFS